MATYTRILMRRRTAAQWAALNEVLMQGELGVITDTVPMSFKIGDGITPWNSLVLALGGIAGSAYSGGITLSTVIGTPTTPVFYSAGEGTYASAGGIIIPAGKIGFIAWSPTAGWTSQILTLDLTNYATTASVKTMLDPIQANFERVLTLQAGTAASTTLSVSYNWVQDLIFVSANKKLRSITFPYSSTAVFSILLYSKSGSTFTVVDTIVVAPVVGSNTVTINKTYTSDIYIGAAKGSVMYYGGATGSILRLGNTALGVGSTAVQDSSVTGLISFSAVYVDSLISIPDLATQSSVTANSLAIAAAQSKLIDKISTLTDIDNTSDGVSGFYLSATGVLTAAGGYFTSNLRAVIPGDVVKYSGLTVGSGVRAVIGYNANGTFNQILLGVVTAIDQQTITIPAGVFGYRMSSSTSAAYQFLYSKYMVNASSLSIPLLNTIDSEFNSEFSESNVVNIPFDWKGGAFSGAAYFGSGSAMNASPATDNQSINSIEWDSNSASTDTIVEVQVLKFVAGVPVNIKTVIPVISSTSIQGTVVTQVLSNPIYIARGHYVAIKVSGVRFTSDATTGMTTWYLNTGSSWATSGSNRGFFFNYYGKKRVGVKDQIQSLQNSLNIIGDPGALYNTVTKNKVKIVDFLRYDFSQATTNWIMNSWTASAGAASTTTLNSMLQFKLRFVSDKRIMRAHVKFKLDDVLSFGTVFQSATTTPETQVIIDIPNSIIKIYRQSTTVMIASVSLPALVADKEYVIELQRNSRATTVRLIDPITTISTSVSYDYLAGTNNYSFGAGNHSPYYYFMLTAGSGISISSFAIYGQYKPFYAAAGDSITDSNGRCVENHAERKIRLLGGDGAIIAKTQAGIGNLIESLSNEIMFMKPAVLDVMIGTNDTTPTQAQYQTIVDFCATNGIILLLNHVVCKFDNSHIPKNATIDLLKQKGAKYDVATALNNDPSQGVNPALYNEVVGSAIHPNQLGNNLMADRSFLDSIPLRTF